MPSPSIVLVDDRLLITEMLVGLPRVQPQPMVHTTAYWYYRACRALVVGGGGHLSAPFEQLSPDEREQAILDLLNLREDIGLPDPRATIPVMADMAGRHPRLNVLNLEAAAAARVLDAMVWLSEPSAAGVLPPVLDAEGLAWKTVALPPA